MSAGEDVAGVPVGDRGAGRPADGRPARERRPRMLWRVLLAVVALLVAYDLFEAVANLVGVVVQVDAYNEFADANGLALARIPWVVLVANVLVSPVAFVVALRLGRGRALGQRALMLLAGLAAAAAVSLSLAAFA